MSIQFKPFSLFTLAILIFTGASLPALAAIKCWTNNEGVRECGNAVPPEYSQQGHQELSKQGTVMEEQGRAKTEEEIQAGAKLEEEKAAEKLKQAEQAKADKVLLATFSTVADIELVRDERLLAIEASIKLAEKRTETIKADHDKRIQSAADAERAGNTPNEALLKDIESLKRQIDNNNAYIADKRKEQEQTTQEYAANIERFKKLKGLD